MAERRSFGRGKANRVVMDGGTNVVSLHGRAYAAKNGKVEKKTKSLERAAEPSDRFL